MNVACRTVSGPLCIKGDHSDVMYLLNTGWIILFADEPQKVYDFNLLGLKLAEAVRLPGRSRVRRLFTSHQKRKCLVFENDDTVTRYIGEKLSCDNPKVSAFAGTGTCGAAGELPYASVLDLAHPVSIGSYMNEPDVINNRYQLHLAMEAARNKLPELFTEYAALSAGNFPSAVPTGTRTPRYCFCARFLLPYRHGSRRPAAAGRHSGRRDHPLRSAPVPR